MEAGAGRVRAEGGGGSLSDRTARGVAWAIAQTAGAKGVTFVTQIALGWFLVREDYGVWALAMSIATFVAVLQFAGVQEIVIQRQRRFGVWANPAFWLATVLGLASAVLVVAASPVAAWAAGEPRLVPIMALIALSMLMNSMGVVAAAKLQIELRMKELSVYQLAAQVIMSALQVGLAWAGWGPYALVAPMVAVVPVYVVPLWLLARPPVRWRMQARRWRYMVGDSVRLMGTGLLNNTLHQGAVLVLKVFHTTGVVGLYYFAYNLSAQTVVLLTWTLSTVLFPALSRLQGDAERMLAAFLRAARVLSLVAVPACFLQAALTGPLVRLLWPDDKWLDAVPIAQVLCIGMAFNILSVPSTSLLKARGEFGKLLRVTAGYTATFVGAITLGAALGEGLSVAVSWTAYAVVWGPLLALLVIRPLGGGMGDVARIFLAPAACAAAAMAPVYLVGRVLPPTAGWDLAQLVVGPAVGGGVYLLLARVLMPGPLRELVERLTGIAPPLGRLVPGWLVPRAAA